LATIVSCSEDFGSEVVGGNLTVFYTNAEDKLLASDFVLFYKNNNLILTEPQHIQITRIKKGYRVNIIAKDVKEAQKMNFKNRKALLKLHGMLQNSVFIKNKVDLIVCDDQFKPIIKINK
jgi:hypothetical protein